MVISYKSYVFESLKQTLDIFLLAVLGILPKTQHGTLDI